MAAGPQIKSGQPGNALSLEGGEIKAISTGKDILTITGSTNQDANYLVIRSNTPRGSTIGTNNIFSISSAGQLGHFKKTCTTLGDGTNWGATALALSSSNSGKLHIVPACTGAGTITLPTTGYPAGTFFPIMFYGAANTSNTWISASAGSQQIQLNAGGNTSTGQKIKVYGATTRQLGSYIEFTAINTTCWFANPTIGIGSSVNAATAGDCSAAIAPWVLGASNA